MPVLSKTEDIANARLRLANGCIVNLTASRVSIERLRKVRLFQTDAYVSIDLGENKITIVRREGAPGGARAPRITAEKLELDAADALLAQDRAFAESRAHARRARGLGRGRLPRARPGAAHPGGDRADRGRRRGRAALRVFLSTADASGDLHARGAASRRCASARSSSTCSGSAAPRSPRPGFRPIVPQSELAIAGLVEVLGSAPRVLGAYTRLRRALDARRRARISRCFVDSPDLNLPLASVAKRARRAGALLRRAAGLGLAARAACASSRAAPTRSR